MDISSTETKLFTIRCDISQATQLQDIMQIVVVTNTIPVAKRILICPIILINYIPLLFHMISESSSTRTPIILSLSKTV